MICCTQMQDAKGQDTVTGQSSADNGMDSMLVRYTGACMHQQPTPSTDLKTTCSSSFCWSDSFGLTSCVWVRGSSGLLSMHLESGDPLP